MHSSKRIPIIAFSLTMLFLSGLFGCAGMSPNSYKKEAEVQDQKSPPQSEINGRKISDIQTSLDTINHKIDTLNKRLDLLEKRRKPKRMSHKTHVRKHPAQKTHRKTSQKKATVQHRKKAVSAQHAVPKNTGKPLKLYHDAYKLYAARKFKMAVEAFSGFLKRYPKHPYASNALYWTGESYYSMGHYEKAAGYFKEVVKKYPKGNKTPDALLKLGYTYAELGKKKEARTYLFDLMDKFPFSEAAQKAQAKLDALY